MQANSNIEPRLQTGCAQPYVAIAIQVTLKEWNKGNTLANEVKEWLQGKEAKIAGPLFYRYYVMGDAEKPFHIEVGFPVSAFIEGDSRVITGHVPDGSFATLIHCGHPDQLEQTFEVLDAWAKEQHLKWKKSDGKKDVWAGRFEFFMNVDEPDMNNWRTAIAVLIDG
ncbi:GyrI-like domain-containing protein [Mucilaginibacter terrae]|uniref:Effector-binding domain-containing protein n=1 Tax=Mucilaginibacter terrae TaxID=1955052 RepID=A0ABU3GTW3_9SPHI|nr:GyrI-like domain-containing protein [Mucilaginibacter terrae]MDT3403216.1 effector-binding domain-containing protein [Mucilaginibacter terrae]